MKILTRLFPKSNIAFLLVWLGTHIIAAGAHAGASEKTYVYFPIVGKDGAGSVAEFTITEYGSLAPLTLPSVATGLYPYAIAVDPLNSNAYVATWTAPGEVDQYAIRADGPLVATGGRVRTGKEPYPIVLVPNGRYAVLSNNNDRTIAVYRIQASGALSLVDTVATGKETRSVVADPAGRYVYGANYDSDTVSEYALDSSGQLTIKGAVGVGQLPYNVAISPNGKFLYSANRGSGDVTQFAISSLDGSLRRIGTMLSGAGSGSGANWVTIDSAGKLAFVTNYYEGTVSQFTINPSTGRLTSNGSDVKVGAHPVQIAIDPSNQFAYVANSGDNSISEMRLNSDGTLSTGSTVLRRGGKSITLGGVVHLPGAPWTIAFARR